MPSALLVGAFGQSNPGDEALLTAFRDALPAWDVVATSSSPADTRAAHGVPAISTADPLGVLRGIRSSDGVVFAGGTIFKTLHPSTGRPARDLLRTSLAVTLAARAARKPVVMLGVGAGRLPDPAARRLARGLVRACDLLVLRDEESAQALAAAGSAAPMRVGSDPVWTLLDDAPQPAALPSRDQEADRAVVVLSGRSDGCPPDSTLAGLCRRLGSRGLRLELQPWQVGWPDRDDADLARRVLDELDPASRARTEIVAPLPSLRAARDRFASARLVVGQSFHSLVAAAAAGTPFLAVADEPAGIALARRMRQPVLSPGALEPGAAAALDLTLENVLDRALMAAPPAPAAVRAEVAAADQGYALLTVVLGAGDRDPHDLSGLRLEPAPWAF